jgi:hypothetical protein
MLSTAHDPESVPSTPRPRPQIAKSTLMLSFHLILGFLIDIFEEASQSKYCMHFMSLPF